MLTHLKMHYLLYLLLPLILVYLFKYTFGRRWNLPPGPFSLPFIGNLLHILRRQPYLAFYELAQQYGDVFTFVFFGSRYIVVSSAELAREALVSRKDDFSGRPMPSPYVASLITGNSNDIVMVDYDSRLVLKRKVVHSALRTYGSNQQVVEKNISQQVEKLIEAFEARNGEPFDPHKDLYLAVLNTIFAIVFKNQYDVEDPEFLDQIKSVEYFNKMCCPSHFINVMPWLAIFPWPSIKELHERIARRDEVYRRFFREHKESFDANNIRDLTDAVIKTFDESHVGSVSMSEDDLLVLLNDVFVAGFETITTTMRWFLIYMVLNPDVQRKTQEELDRVVGRDKRPALHHRSQLPYTQALIAEVMRVASVLPIGIPHKAMCDTKLGGYDIPKGTGLIINAWSINNDKREWREPEKLKPERFIDEKGAFVGYADMSFLPFGAGRRVCLGENLAKIELFLLISTLLHSFHLEKVSPDAEISLETSDSYSHSPLPYKLRAIPRY